MSLLLSWLVLLVCAAPAAATCAPFTDQEYANRVQVIVEGTVLEHEPGRSALLKAQRYLKGSGPSQLRIAATAGDAPGPSGIITLRPGERWRLYGRMDGPRRLVTSDCEGTRRLGQPVTHPAPSPQPPSEPYKSDGEPALLAVFYGLAGLGLAVLLLLLAGRRR